VAQATYEYKPLKFFVMTFVVTWTPWFIGAHLSSQKGMEAAGLLLNLIGLLGPLAMALFMVFGSGSTALKADFKDRLINLRRIRPALAIASVAVPFAIIVVSIAASLLLGESTDQFQMSISVGMIIIAMLLAPLIEETGWRGYAVDSLRARMGMLRSSIVFGVLWALWHAPLALIHGTYQYEVAHMANPIFIANFFLGIVAVGVIKNWLYYRNDRSIPCNVLLHSMLNAAAILLGAGQVAKTIASIFLALAIALVWRDRELFLQGPRNFIEGRVPG